MSKKSSSSTSGPSKEALPYLNSASSAVTNAYTGNQANISNIDNALQSNMGTVLGNTLNNSNLSAAGNYDQGVLSSSADPTTNPLFMNMLNQTNATASNAANAAIGTRGLAGGSAQTQLLGNEISKADNSALLSQYNTNVGAQQTAASNATSVANGQNNGISAALQYLTGQATIPTTGADSYAQQIANLWGKSTTSTSTPSGLSSLEGLLGTGTALAGVITGKKG